MVEQRALQRQVGLGLADLHLLRGAGQLRQARLGLGLVEALERGQLAFTQGWSEVVVYFWLTSAPADFKSGKSIKNAQITRLFLCF